ncbi:hypothetical protein ACIBSV_37080 [Embleya sp. NPDC050154]|uniref:hypothetical protein n=1 Tax=unclassified Embleya TaxID=2699296 RepID=UPI003799F946
MGSRVVAIGLKVLLGGLLTLAVVFDEWARFADKAMGMRAVLYPVAVMALPIWWLARRRKAFPWDVDALITLPFVVDVAGNAADLYDRVAWFDDACHFGNWAVLGTACAVSLRRWSRLPGWAVTWCCAGAGAIAAILWEFFEYGAFVLDTPESVSIYRDTMGDLLLGLLGATVAAAIAGRRMRPRVGEAVTDSSTRSAGSTTSTSCTASSSAGSGEHVVRGEVGAQSMPGRVSAGVRRG